MRVYRDAIVVDTHNDMPSKVLDEGYDPDVRHTPAEGHTDIPRLVESGLTAQFMAAWVDAPYALRQPDGSFERALRYMEAIHAFICRNPGSLLFASTADEIRQAKREGKVAILIGVEGGHAIEESLDKLRELRMRGASYLTLTWNNGNQWAGSSIGSGGTRTGGLTPFGENVIREMNRLGMLVDLSHTSEETFYDAIAVSRSSVIASHSCARAISDHPRNLTDHQLRAIAKNGGVVQVNFFPRFIETRYRVAMDDVESAVDARRPPEGDGSGGHSTHAPDAEALRRTMMAAIPPTPLALLIDHIDHIARVAGEDHVGALGSDFDGISATPAQMADVTAMPRVAQALLDRGYSEEATKKMLGGNVLRVLEEAARDRDGEAGIRDQELLSPDP